MKFSIYKSKGHLVAGITLVMVSLFVSGCLTHPGNVRETSLNVDVEYEAGKDADRIRVSRPFWTGPETFGWLESHHFLREEVKPDDRVATVIWLVEYDERTGERKETRYWVTRREWREHLENIRYSEGTFVLIKNRHESDVLEKDLFYRISPGNKITDDRQTGRHRPLDFAFGLHLSAQSFTEVIGTHEGGQPRTGTVGVGLRFYDVGDGEVVQEIPVRGQWLLNSDLEARFIDPETIFFCLPRIERSGDKSYRTFEFRLFRIPEEKLVPYGTVRVKATGYMGWDVSPTGEYFALGAVNLPPDERKMPGSPTMVWKIKEGSISGETVKWEQFSVLPFGVDPVFSPDGERLVVDESASFRRTARGVNRYFEDDNPLKGFRFYDVERTER